MLSTIVNTLPYPSQILSMNKDVLQFVQPDFVLDFVAIGPLLKPLLYALASKSVITMHMW